MGPNDSIEHGERVDMTRRWAWWIVSAGLVGLLADPAGAIPLIQVESVGVDAVAGVEARGAFDLLLIPDPDDPTASLNLSGWSLQLDLSPAHAGVAFDAISNRTGEPYVFDGLPTSPQATTLSGDQVQASDLHPRAGGAGGFVTLRDIAGLLHIEFTVSPDAIGDFVVNIGTASRFSVLSDGSFPDPMAIDFAFTPGTITVTRSIPEPASVVLGCLSLIVGALATGRRRFTLTHRLV